MGTQMVQGCFGIAITGTNQTISGTKAKIISQTGNTVFFGVQK